MKHCTLTAGDTLKVEHAGSEYVLRVSDPTGLVFANEWTVRIILLGV